jgi:hypothetical protein
MKIQALLEWKSRTPSTAMVVKAISEHTAESLQRRAPNDPETKGD